MSDSVVEPDAPRSVVERFYRSTTAGDMADALECLAPDIVLHQAESLPYAGSHHGLAAAAAVAGQIAEVLDLAGMVVDDIVADGEHVVGLVRLPLRSDPSREMRLSEHSWVRNGKIAEVRAFYWDTAALLDRASDPQ